MLIKFEVLVRAERYFIFAKDVTFFLFEELVQNWNNFFKLLTEFFKDSLVFD